MKIKLNSEGPGFNLYNDDDTMLVTTSDHAEALRQAQFYIQNGVIDSGSGHSTLYDAAELDFVKNSVRPDGLSVNEDSDLARASGRIAVLKENADIVVNLIDNVSLTDIYGVNTDDVELTSAALSAMAQNPYLAAVVERNVTVAHIGSDAELDNAEDNLATVVLDNLGLILSRAGEASRLENEVRRQEAVISELSPDDDNDDMCDEYEDEYEDDLFFDI